MNPTTLDEFHGAHRESGTQLLYQCCPVCGSQRWKTYVNPATGGWFCFAGGHGGGGRVEVGRDVESIGHDILKALHPPPVQSQEWPEINLPPWEGLTPRALRYLERRGISEDEARRLVLVEAADDEHIGYLIIPHFNVRSEIVYWASRAYASYAEGPKYNGASGRKPLYLPEHGLGSGPHEQIVVCEGPFDAISIWQAGYVAAAIGGKALPTYLIPDVTSSLRDGGELIIMLDKVALGDALKMRRQLESKVSNVRIAVPPTGDPGDMRPEEIKEMLG